MSGGKKIRKFIGITATMLGTVFAGMEIWAKIKKDNSVYKNEPSEQNPMEGKKVVFIEDDNDLENADGVRGHLEAIGDSDYCPGFYEKYVKRALDVVLSFGGLLVLSPIFIGLSIAIFIDDPGPIFFTQKRLGQNKKYFKLHKFRSMKMSTPHDVPTHMLDNPDQYITKVGKFIRAHSLDELPQIWDIFVGNMSVIGPRPGLWNQDVLTAERDKYGANDVKPGLTGWAQINGRDELEIPDKARLDGEYTREIGFKMDMKCFLESLGVFNGDGSVVEGGTGELRKKENLVNEMKEMVGSERFSVLMAVYAKEKPDFFDLALKSNLDYQSRKPDEFVLVCDGPLTRDLDSIIENYERKYPDCFKIYRLEKNQGLGNALNFGLNKCSYEIVLRSDSDDVCDKNRFAIQVEFMEKNPDIAICSSYIDEFDSDWTKPFEKKTLPLTHEELFNMAKFRNPINHMAAAFRKNIIVDIGSYHHIPYVEDYELWVRALINGYHIANIGQVLVHARVGNGMISRRGNREYIKSWEQLSRYMLSNNMITIFQYYKNIISVRGFIYMPSSVKKVVYKLLLRK